MTQMAKLKTKIIPQTLEFLASKGFTRDEVASAFSCDVGSINRFLLEHYKMTWMDFKRKFQTHMKDNLLQMAYKEAEGGNWKAIEKLCDVYVWTEHKQKIELTGDSDAPIAIQSKVDYDKLSVEELERLQQISEKLKPDDSI